MSLQSSSDVQGQPHFTNESFIQRMSLCTHNSLPTSLHGAFRSHDWFYDHIKLKIPELCYKSMWGMWGRGLELNCWKRRVVIKPFPTDASSERSVFLPVFHRLTFLTSDAHPNLNLWNICVTKVTSDRIRWFVCSLWTLVESRGHALPQTEPGLQI